MRVLVVGGVAAGASAAARLRRLDEFSEIVIFERGPYISFANCGLPYYVGGVIQTQDKILLQTPKTMRDRFNIDVRVFSEVVAVNSEQKTITVRTAGAETEESYDALILAPGSKPLVPPIPGVASPRIVYMRNVDDAEGIKERVKDAKRAVVIGGGFIGLETAENLVELGLDVTLVEAAPHIMAPMDSDMSPALERELERNGVRLILNNGVTAFEDTVDGLNITLADGQVLETDFCLLSVGVRPDTEWLRSSGLALDGRGFIRVDDQMRTNLPGVYAAGDAVVHRSAVTGKEMAIQLAGPANRQGRIAADNIMGIPSKYKGSIGTSVIKVFELTGAATGMNERMLRANQIPCKAVILHPKNHADYYPGACNMHLKVIYGEDGRVLGAQAVAAAGADKFIDVIATVITMGGTMEDLENLELAYAPAYLSAKSPANFAGFVAGNEARGLVENIDVMAVDTPADDEIVLDVRLPEQVAMGCVAGSIHIPVNDLRGRLNELEPYRDKTILVYCESGVRSYIACRMLNQRGFKAKNVRGGYHSYAITHGIPKE